MAPKVLVILTSHAETEDKKLVTGWYLPELAHPWSVLSERGAEFVFASPKGGEAPISTPSIEASKDDALAQSFYANQKQLWTNTVPLTSVAETAGTTFDAVLIPGGHGPVYDLVDDVHSRKIIGDVYNAGKPVAAVCHGPAALVNVKDAKGEYIYAGKQVTVFTDDEEASSGLEKVVPYLVESVLRERGAHIVKADKLFGEKVAVDGNLITGQNPASSQSLGEALAKALGI